MRLLCLAPLALFLGPAGASAAELRTPDEISACVQRNIPEASNIQTVRLTTRDRVGNVRITEAQIYGRRDRAGQRRVLARFTKPDDLEGAGLLMVERDGSHDVALRSSELASVKRIQGEDAFGAMFGTDLSYEDFARLQGFRMTSSAKRLDDAVVAEHPVYVLETRPSEGDESAYESLVTFIDKSTCVALKTELYERGHRLRKVVTATPDRVLQLDSVWIAHQVSIRDVRDGTETDLEVQSVDFDVEIRDSDLSFETFELKRPPPPLELDVPTPKLEVPGPTLPAPALDDPELDLPEPELELPEPEAEAPGTGADDAP